MAAMVGTFVFFLLAFTAVGVASSRSSRATTTDYLVADREVKPWLVALSAVSSMNSGYMFIGIIGFTYLYGISSLWLSVVWRLGDYAMWWVVHERLREHSGHEDVDSIPSFLAHDGARLHRPLAVLAGVITLVFLSLYAAAQLQAGSKALHVIFGWPTATGAVLGSIIVVIYCFSGGIRASIWTDAAQSIVMLAGMLMLFGAGVAEFGWLGALYDQLQAIDPALVAVVPPGLQFGMVLYCLGWLAAGVGTMGQPHVMIRMLTLDDARRTPQVRRIYWAWNWAFMFLAHFVGMYARLLLDAESFDQELALPMMAVELLPAFAVGMVLAALFAASMSTADSQILSCSAAITQDIGGDRLRRAYGAGKLATIAATGFALVAALWGPPNVFTLVQMAWAALGSALGPLLILRALRRPVAPPVAMLMMTVPLVVVAIWRFTLGWHLDIYDALPGIVASFGVYIVLQPILGPRRAEAS